MGGLGELGLVVSDAGLAISGPAILVGVLTVLGIALIFVGLQRVSDTRGGSITNQLDKYVGPVQQQRRAGLALLRRERKPRAVPVYQPTNGAARAGTFSMRIARELAQADLKITFGEYIILTGVLSSLGALVGLALPLAGHFILAVVLCFAGLFGPRLWIRRKRKRRQNAFNSQLADMLGLMTGAMRSGYALIQSMELAAREGPSPASAEFDRVVREVGLGNSPEEALGNLLERMQSEDLELLVTAMNVQREVGGNMVEVLDTIAFTIRERVKLKGQIAVLTAQQQYSGYIIACLPIALALMLTIINPSYMLGVFSTTLWCGWTMVGCSGAMIFAGFLVIRKIVNIKV